MMFLLTCHRIFLWNFNAHITVLYVFAHVPSHFLLIKLINCFLFGWNNLIGMIFEFSLIYVVENFFWFIYIYLRTSRSEFIVSINKYLEARNHKLSVGMRFKMRFEGDEVPERRCASWLLKSWCFDFSKFSNIIIVPCPLNTGLAVQLWVLKIINRPSGLILSGDH